MSWKWKQNVYFSEITISGEQVFVCLFAWSRVCKVWGLKALQSFLSLHQTVREEIPINEVHTAHLNWQKIQCKNVYEIQIHAWTPNYSSLAWKTKKLGKRCKMCAVQCAMCTVRTLIAKNFSIRMFTKSKFSGSVRSDLTTPFKRPRKKMLVLRISEKMVEKQRRCAQISPSAFLSIAPCKKKSCLFVYKM